jgi:hypothetical protein
MKHGQKRLPDGKPVPGYYPAVVTQEEWYAARAALGTRRNKGGRLSPVHVNLFAGQLRDACDGGTINVTDKGSRSAPHRLLVASRADSGAGTRYTTFPLDTFEPAVLRCLREIDPHDVLPHNGHEDKVLVLTVNLAEVEKLKAGLEA